MKLTDKIQNLIANQLISIEDKSELIEKITEDFAISFSNWTQCNVDLWITYTTKELLEIYKKQK